MIQQLTSSLPYRAVLVSSLIALSGASTQPSTASLHGTLKTSGTLLRAVAVDRAWADIEKSSALTATGGPKDDFLYEAALAPGGAFRINNLLPGRAYDLIVWTKDAQGVETRWEGVSMNYHRDIQLSTPATPDDRNLIESAISDPKQFYDKVRVLRLAADHGHATALVELLRTRDFHSDKGGEVIYRVELWYYENLFGGWAKDKNTERVLTRLRGTPQKLPQNLQYEPTLGGLTPSATPLTLTLPDKPDPRHGLAGGIQ
jgi:hypothetical protein